MATSSNQDKTTDSETPFWSIGITALIILLAPLVLYSFAPEGPLREGDTVFSEGQQQVKIERTASGHEVKGDTCLLDPNSPLIVIYTQTSDADSSIMAQVQGNPSDEWPFCPVHTEVVVKTRQLFQKPAIFETVREFLVGFALR